MNKETNYSSDGTLVSYKESMRSCDQSPGLISRKIWQGLFKAYRLLGDLEEMDSFLCDLDLIKSWVENCQRDLRSISIPLEEQYNKIYFAFWSVSGWYTSFQVYQDRSDLNIYSIKYRPYAIDSEFEIQLFDPLGTTEDK